MLINKSIRTKDKDTDAYIEGLESEIESFNAINVRLLIRSIDNMALRISKRLDLIAKSETPIEDDADFYKQVDIFLKMVDKSEKIKDFADVVASLDRGLSEEAKELESKLSGKKGLTADVNPFEQMQKKVTGKNG